MEYNYAGIAGREYDGGAGRTSHRGIRGIDMKDFIIAILISACGLPFLFMGYLIWIRERIDLIHDYHHTKVKESDRKEYTAVMGKATILAQLKYNHGIF